jgi:hypothetical protein
VSDRRLCGRPTRTGSPCGAVVRISVALGRAAPACRRHMSDQERIEFDSDPLWSEEGQISWLLEHRDDGDVLLSAGDIAARLRIQRSVVTAVLDRMEIAGTVRAFREGRRTSWGSRAQAIVRHAHQQQAERDAAAACRAVVESNAALAETETVLREICAGQAVEVSIFDPVWRDPDSTRGHTLMISVQDAQAAGWIVDRRRICRRSLH